MNRKTTPSSKRTPSSTPPEFFLNLNEKPVKVQFDISQDNPLFVTLNNKTDEKPLKDTMKWFTPSRRIILVMVLLVTLIYSASFIPFNPRTQEIPGNLLVTYTPQEYISRGDKNSVYISLTNLSHDKPFTGSIALIIFDKNIPIMASTGQKMSLAVENLNPGDRIAGQINFTLPIGSPKQNNVSYYFQVFNPDGTPYHDQNGILSRSYDDIFLVSGLYVRTIMALIVSILSLVFTTFIGGLIKKVLGAE